MARTSETDSEFSCGKEWFVAESVWQKSTNKRAFSEPNCFEEVAAAQYIY